MKTYLNGCDMLIAKTCYKNILICIIMENKYLKYKLKYLNLKKQLRQKGGNGYANALIMGAGPMGLITTLSLLKEKTENKLKINNIFIIERTNYWKPQIFFFQNSFRDYGSIDYLRDIDLELFQKLEKISCYIGSPPSTVMPYCFNYDNGTDVSETSKHVRAGSSIYDNENDTYPSIRSKYVASDGTLKKILYPLLHLSFHVSTLETMILDRIIELNNINISYYVDCQETIVNEKIKIILNIIKTLVDGQCEGNLLIALLIKYFLPSETKPLVIVYHPYNKFCNIYIYDYFNLLKNYINERMTSDINVIE